MEVLARHEGRKVGINYDDPLEIKSAQLVNARSDYLTVLANGVLHHFPANSVLSASEAAHGNLSSGTFWKTEHSIVIFVFHQVIYKGSIGVEIPL